MKQDEAALHELARAILDGAAIDWPSVESGAVDLWQQQILRDMRVIAAIAEFHGSAPLDQIGSAPGTLSERAAGALEIWGTLRVAEKVGQGAYGDVYRAWDTRLDREVALKLLRACLADGDARATTIIEEGRLLARVRHPGVVTIYGAERLDDRIGLWMEFVRGQTLEQLLERGHAFDSSEVIDIGLQLCGAVSAVHGAGLLHRDIKAQNVMRADDGRVVLMDFGAGRELGEGHGPGLAGTPLYLAPELLAGEPASVRSDIYSLGVLLFHLVTGSYPVSGDRFPELKLAHRRGDRTDIRAMRPAVRPRLARIIERAIDPLSDRRYPTAQALESELKALAPRPKLVTLVYSLTLAAVLLLVVGAGVEWRSRRTGTPGPASILAAGLARLFPAPPSRLDQPVIAVLPFENLSTEPDSDLLVEGLAVEILHNLAVIDGLQVRARESSFAFRNTTARLQEIGQQLGADLFLQCSVRLSGRQLRVNPRLVRSDGTVLWADQFDRKLEDVFQVQDEISRAIVNGLRLTLGRGQRRYDTDIETYELYLKGRALIGRRGVPSLEQAAYLFGQVLARDPGYAPAHAGLSHAYALMSAPLSSTMPLESAHAVMRPAALRARELDPLLAEAHAAMGWVYSREFDWQNAEKAFQEAIRLDPSLTHTHTGYSISTLRPAGKLDEALRILQGALQNDPLSLDVQREIGTVQLAAGRYDEAIQTLQHVRAVDPVFPFANSHLGRALTFAGRLAEAMPVLEGLDGGNLGSLKDPKARRAPWLAKAYVMSGRREDAEALAREHEDSPAARAVVHAALGNIDHVFDALEQLAAVQPHHVGRLMLLPELADLRGDPRYAALRERFRLTAR